MPLWSTPPPPCFAICVLYFTYNLPFQVRKLWGDYSEAKVAIDSPHCSSTTSAESREGEEYDAADAVAIASAVHSSSSGIAAGQGPARALLAFVDAVDLADARQAAVLQNLVSTWIWYRNA